MVIDLTKEFGITSFEDEKLKKVSRNVYNLVIGTQDVYIKKIDLDEYFYSELLGAEILDILNIPRVKIGVGYLGETKCLLSYASYNKKEESITGEKLLEQFYEANKGFIDENPNLYGKYREEAVFPLASFNNLHTIWYALEWYIETNQIKDSLVSELLDSLIMQFLFNNINNIPDLHDENWILLHQNNTLKIYPKCDVDGLVNYFLSEKKIKPTFNMTVYATNKKDSDDVLTDFLNVSEEKYLDLVTEMVEKLINVGAEIIVASVEIKWNINIPNKDVFIIEYNKRLCAVDKLLDSIKNKRIKKAI